MSVEPRPIVWSIAGTDSGGGAGLSADQRMADVFGVHLCPVVAAITAQNSKSVTHIAPVGVERLEAQLAALEEDMPPAVIKTGLLGTAAQIERVAMWVDRMRTRALVALVVDPVLAASTGASFANADALRAYRDLLLPRASFVTPNRKEAAHLLHEKAVPPREQLPSMARALLRLGVQAVAITGGDDVDAAQPLALDWLQTAQAEGWLAGRRIDTPHTHGTGCSFATAVASAMARGFVPADAAVLAKMATSHAIAGGYAAGRGAGPAHASGGFAQGPQQLPFMSWSESADFSAALAAQRTRARPLGLYAIVDSAERVQQVLSAGVRTVQLRIKLPERADDSQRAELRRQMRQSLDACRAADAELFINDHVELALELGASGVHLGQEDLLALTDAQRARLADCGVSLGISSHSLWELCRAAALAPRYIACGPVWPTLTKAMPWHPQGTHNLSWWCRMSPAPVVAIGGILDAERVRVAAQCGADGVCVVRGIGDDAASTVPEFERARAQGASMRRDAASSELPSPSL